MFHSAVSGRLVLGAGELVSFIICRVRLYSAVYASLDVFAGSNESCICSARLHEGVVVVFHVLFVRKLLINMQG